MKKLLWIGDACVDSGFARATHYTLESLRHRFDVSVLGINYRGDPHQYPYPVYPCWPGGDMFGIGRLGDLIPAIRPNVIVLQNDPWNIPKYMEVLKDVTQIPVVASLAVDGLNCRGGSVNAEDAQGKGLNTLKLAIFWTEFGRREAIAGGYEGPTAVVPLGVDLDVYRPGDRDAARQEAGLPLPRNSLLIGNINRNQPRKRLDLTLLYFAEWLHRYQHKNAFLFLHVAPTGEKSYDLKQLTLYADRIFPGIKNRVLISQPDAFKGLAEPVLANLYRCFDLLVSTSQSEGMGLPALEAMASGIPLVLPDHSAYAEWARDAALLVPCSTIATTPNEINVIGGVPDKEPFIAALERVFQEQRLRQEMRKAGIDTAWNPRYRWQNIGEAFGDAIMQTLWPAEVPVGAEG